MLARPLQQLITTLSQELDLTGKEIAEVVWLALQTDLEVQEDTSTPAPDDPEPTDQEPETDPTVVPPSPPALVQPEPAPAELVPEPVQKTPSFKLPEKYKPIPVPDAPAISQSLQLARALRPLARPIAVGLPTQLDEAATVEQIADTGVWQPVLVPDQELWLDVALIFDQSPSMAIWQKVSQELRRLLSRYGEFRDVRLWNLTYRDQGRIDLVTKNNRLHRPSDTKSQKSGYR